MARALLLSLLVVSSAVAALAQNLNDPVQNLNDPVYGIYKTLNKKPVKKVVKKAYVPLAKVAAPPGKTPFNLDCAVTKAGKANIINCKVYSNLQFPVCVHLACLPAPGGPCKAGAPSQDCSWNVVNGCASPTPLYPGGQWSFGYMTSTKGAIAITQPALGNVVSDAINGTACPR